ncbi:MAG: hypothetical protein LDL07_14750 [Desulfarculus sp.]|nr:hypothetical protein [Desulfarculus sp.]
MDRPPVNRQILLAREGLATLSLLAVLTGAAVFWPLAPVEVGPAQGPTQAPWLFLGLQTLLAHLPWLVGGVLMPGAILGLLAALPWLAGGRGPVIPTYSRRPSAWEYPAWLALAAWAALTWWGWRPHG